MGINLKNIVVAFVAIMIIIGCGLVEPDSVIDGNYVGTYSITHNYGTDSAYTKQGKIFFEFSKGKYNYSVENYLLLPESNGKYGIHKKILFLTDNGRHNGFIDETLLLNGSFTYFLVGEKLTLTQQDNKNKYSHRLKLSKRSVNEM